jgi:hypothetical protein
MLNKVGIQNRHAALKGGWSPFNYKGFGKNYLQNTCIFGIFALK